MVATIPNIENGLDRDEILAHLHQILADRRFASAQRNATFLRFVVESTLEGKSDEIKETVIATEVYGRAGDYDPKADSIVRVEASRLRQKLRSYYENEGKGSRLRFRLPSGSYVPSFERANESVPLEEAAEDVAPITPVVSAIEYAPSSIRRSLLVSGAGIVLIAALLTAKVVSFPGAMDRQDAEGMAAWQEGVALLELDPHTAQTSSGPPKTLLRAIERLEFAVARAPRRAKAWATLAEAYDYASGFVGRDPAEDGRRQDAAARRAIALDDKLAAGVHMEALYLKGSKWDFANAEIAYKRALQLDPYDANAIVEYVDLLLETGHAGRAEEEIRKARALRPGVPGLAVKEAEVQLHMGRAEAALVTATSAVELKRTSQRAHVALGMAYEWQGHYELALDRYRHVLEINPSDRRALPAYGYLLAITGETARAKEIVSQLEKMNLNIRNCAVQVAEVYAGMGEDELALNWLEKAWKTRQAHFPFAAVEYRFRKYHQNPRFKELLQRAGLKPVA